MITEVQKIKCEHNRSLCQYEVMGKRFSYSEMAELYTILFGQEWKSGWPDEEKAREMESIFNGGTKPYVDFSNWVALIKCINDSPSKAIHLQ